jgi:hypothetical protein
MEGSLQQQQPHKLHPQPRHVASGSSGSTSSPELAAAQTEDDYYARGGEKKGRVKQVGRGRKRHLDQTQDDDTVDYSYHHHHHPRSASSSSTSTTSSLYAHPAKSPKRARTFDELEERAALQASDEKQQSAGSTDEEDHMVVQQYQEMPDRDEEEDEEEASHVEEEEEVEEEDYDAVPHPPPRTWVAKAEWALGRLGGRGTLADIYATIEDAFPEEIDGKRNWKAAIRSCLSKNEKNKFFKPETMSAAKGDHVWCLAASTPRRPTTTKRGRPAGRARKLPNRTQGRRRSLADEQKKGKEKEEEEEVKFAVPVQPARREKKGKEEERGRLETLLRWKQQLEQDISRLQEEVNEDGLSADQEDFLSQLLA